MTQHCREGKQKTHNQSAPINSRTMPHSANKQTTALLHQLTRGQCLNQMFPQSYFQFFAHHHTGPVTNDRFFYRILRSGCLLCCSKLSQIHQFVQAVVTAGFTPTTTSPATAPPPGDTKQHGPSSSLAYSELTACFLLSRDRKKIDRTLLLRLPPFSTCNSTLAI